MNNPQISKTSTASSERDEKSKLKEVLVKTPIQNKIFISYSHKDKRWLERIKTVIKPLELKYDLDIWDDQRIRPGDKWNEKIDKALAAARMAILLVSSEFLNSDFVRKHELPYLFKAVEEKGLKLFWIPVSFCLFEETDLQNYKAAGDPQAPLDSLSKAEAGKLLVEIGKIIRDAL